MQKVTKNLNIPIKPSMPSRPNQGALDQRKLRSNNTMLNRSRNNGGKNYRSMIKKGLD